MNLAGISAPDRLRRLVEAALAVGSDLSLPAVLHNLVTAAVDLVDCRYGALGVLSEHHDGLAEFVHVGIEAEQARSIGSRPHGLGLLGLIISEGAPLRLDDLSVHPGGVGFPPHHPAMRSLLGVPVRAGASVFGNLYLSEKHDGEAFTVEDELVTVALAEAAGIAIEKARLHGRVRELTLLEDRTRIGADLQDRVIQRLFGTGLSLQAAMRVVDTPDALRRLQTAVEDLDETIRQIRTTIFALEAPRVRGRDLHAEVLALATEAAATLRLEPHVVLDGPIEDNVTDAQVPFLLAVLRDGLTDVIRRGDAGRVDITVTATADAIEAAVVDDGGTHLAPSPSVDLQRRARQLGASTTRTPGPGGSGTAQVWHVPYLPVR